jgi:hypothetical protein
MKDYGNAGPPAYQINEATGGSGRTLGTVVRSPAVSEGTKLSEHWSNGLGKVSETVNTGGGRLALKALGEVYLASEVIAYDILAMASLGRAWYTWTFTGHLPECALPDGPERRVLEICKEEFPNTFSQDLVDYARLNFPAVDAYVQITQRSPFSLDPNDIVGPGGFGANGFLPVAGSLPYVINFENQRTAGGPAQQIVVTHRLDDDLDLDTFQLDDFGIGELTIDVPDGRQYYNTRVDLRHLESFARQDLMVDVTARLDRATRVVTWTLDSIDPATLDLPISPFVGFLPPNQTAPEGQGFVSYSVRPKANSPSGTRIDAQARIVFDANAPIDTNIWINTLDLVPPTSSVNPLPETNSPSFPVSWSGGDGTGSGIATYDVFVSDNGRPYVLWQDNVSVTSETFTGQRGHSYSFYSVATDNVGHVEAAPQTRDAITRITRILGDLDDDSDVDALDLLDFMGNWTGALEPGTGNSDLFSGDFDGDSDVDSSDLLEFLARWTGSQSQRYSQSVPLPQQHSAALIVEEYTTTANAGAQQPDDCAASRSGLLTSPLVDRVFEG